MPVDPSLPEQVGPALLGYLSRRLGVSGLRFAQQPEAIGHGWETYIHVFRLAGDSLDPAWERTLVMRIYPSADQGERAEQEAGVQRFAVERGYPAASPLAFEPDSAALGWPFMIMEHAPGALLVELGGNPLAVFKHAAMFGDAHVALHRLPVEGCPLPSEGFLVDRQLAQLREMIEQSGVSGLEEPFAWLEANKGTVIPEELSLCHNDFHPLNIILGEDDRITVVDWSGAALGDRHQDIANTLAVVETAPNPLEARNMAERLADRYGRGLFLWLYLRRYRKQLPIDKRRLRYWGALVSFAWWAQLESFKSAGSAASGLKPDTVDRVAPGHLDAVKRYFWQRARP